jgi:hypothetical protein
MNNKYNIGDIVIITGPLSYSQNLLNLNNRLGIISKKLYTYSNGNQQYIVIIGKQPYTFFEDEFKLV